MKRLNIGIIGCGNISAIYLQNLQAFEETEVIAVADLDLDRAKKRAEEYGIAHACTPDELLQLSDIELVVNLTVPKAHAAVCRQALESGKHVYVEKPLSVTVDEGESLVALARSKGLLLGCAPDTFLGAGIQTCLELIRSGKIGRPLSATAFMLSKGHEHWHPAPHFYYEQGGGPLYDMGPYYLTALVQLIGPIRRVSGSAAISFAERTVTSKEHYGEKIRVETPTHLTGTMEFVSGAVGTMIMSFDIMTPTQYPYIEIFGSEGTLRVPDPNTFSGPVLLRGKDNEDWQEIEVTHQYADNARGIGVLDMAYAIRNSRLHRANGSVALHVLEAMVGFHQAAEQGKHIELLRLCDAPQPLPKEGIVN
ncbi:gfo/Idh/MocA family oxidoreductase [Xylanibacillus composti]|uniref:Oxidoreductase n=1 Tax=Xylanibacillus composti TaxID=1572762 RepID=A0A8J4H3T0_9BACL|nr:Gfo/Idh/MocA family oxidoreductase [Xylanibacillus composti]MDT9723568.1 gfo/Idh/MocA family oxidoreductase [Xylanibacillus composti]GIQ68394.1 oxidoreductase [Xylanibacillus composti]